MKQLTKAVDGRRVTARYCCGGRVRSLPSAVPDEKPRKVSQLIMRWDDPEDEVSRKVDFPFNNSQPSRKFDAQIETLTKRRETIGLNASDFSIDFDPHYHGIIDVISQVLVPGFEGDSLKRAPQHRGVKAKLSNFQVSSLFAQRFSMLLIPEGSFGWRHGLQSASRAEICTICWQAYCLLTT